MSRTRLLKGLSLGVGGSLMAMGARQLGDAVTLGLGWTSTVFALILLAVGMFALGVGMTPLPVVDGDSPTEE